MKVLRFCLLEREEEKSKEKRDGKGKWREVRKSTGINV